MPSKLVDAGDGRVVEFPEGMSDEDIGKALKGGGQAAAPPEKPGFASTFLHDVNPVNFVPAMGRSIADSFTHTPMSDAIGEMNKITPEDTAYHQQALASRKAILVGGGHTAPEFTGPPNPPEELPTYGESFGHVAAGAVNGLALAALTDGAIQGGGAAFRALKSARTPNPDLLMVRASSPHATDTRYLDNIGPVRENIQRGATLTGKPVVDVPTALEATNASMKEHMAALDGHIENAKITGATLPVGELKAAKIQALPNGLEARDPEEYTRQVKEINSLFPGKKTLSTQEVFDNARLNNSERSAFFAGKSGSQNSKLLANAGDAATLKAEGDFYRKWIADNVGQEAADINSSWGQLNGQKHYLESKVIAAAKQKPVTPLEGLMNKLGINDPAHPLRGVTHGVIDRAMSGVPNEIDGMLKAAFEHTNAAEAPVVAGRIPSRLEAPMDSSGPIYNERNNPIVPRRQLALPAPMTQVERNASALKDFLQRAQHGENFNTGERGTGPRLLSAPEEPGVARSTVTDQNPNRTLVPPSPRGWLRNPTQPPADPQLEVLPQSQTVLDRYGMELPHGVAPPPEPPPSLTRAELHKIEVRKILDGILTKQYPPLPPPHIQ
jgi:hypothetical protein